MNVNVTVNYGVKLMPEIQHEEEGNNIRAFYIDECGNKQLLSSIGYGEDSGVKLTLKYFKELGGALWMKKLVH